MSEEEKKTDGEEKTIPRPEGYTIVKYLEFVVFLFWGTADILIVHIVGGCGNQQGGRRGISNFE